MYQLESPIGRYRDRAQRLWRLRWATLWLSKALNWTFTIVTWLFNKLFPNNVWAVVENDTIFCTIPSSISLKWVRNTQLNRAKLVWIRQRLTNCINHAHTVYKKIGKILLLVGWALDALFLFNGFFFIWIQLSKLELLDNLQTKIKWELLKSLRPPVPDKYDFNEYLTKFNGLFKVGCQNWHLLSK